MSEQKSKWQAEFDALPEWAQKMVRAAQHCSAYGSGVDYRDRLQFQATFEGNANSEWFDGFLKLKQLADALTAPWPAPVPPQRERRAVNLVELVAGDDEGGGFDQPCAFGNRVGGHAVYCHNTAWPNSPRKCRRDRDEYRHEGCPGFVANPDVTEPSPATLAVR